jgi:hypothetical protein
MAKRIPTADSALSRRTGRTYCADHSSLVADAEERPVLPFSEQFAILIQCESERQQAELLQRLTKEGLRCRSLIV